MLPIPIVSSSILLFTVFVNILITLFVYRRNPKSATHRIFSLLGFTISIWLIVMHVSLIPFPKELSLFLIRLSIFLATPMSMLFFLLADTLPGEKLRLSKKSFLYLTAVTIGVMAICISPYAFTDLRIEENGLTPTPGFGLFFFVGFALGGNIGAIYILFTRFQKAYGIWKEQFRFMMVGVLLMHALMIVTVLIPVAVFQNNAFVAFAPLYTLIFLFMASYAIIRHKLMDIRLIVARTVAYTLLLIVIGVFYSFAFFSIGSTIFSFVFSPIQLAFYLFITLVVAYTFQPLRHVIEGATDKIFFKDLYDPQELLKAFSLIMSSTIKLNSLSLNILEKVILDMKVTRGAFALFAQKDNQVIEYIEQRGYEKIPQFTALDIHAFFEGKKLYVLDDLEEGPLKELMRKLHTTVVLQLRVNEQRIGVLLLGEKASGDIYSEQDMRVFEILAPQLSVAIQNSREYEEIKRFNITLTEEIDKATKELQGANEKLKQLDKLKDEFVSLASHELRTPMTAIKSYLWMALAGKGGDLSEKQKYYLDRAFKSTDRLIKLVNDMLNVSRIESGRIQLDLKDIAIDQLVQDVVVELQPRAQELGVKLSVVASFSLQHVLADSDKIKEVIINLVGNSMKFTPKDGTITISCNTKDGMIETKVADTGVGMTADDMQKLFQKFNKVGDNYLQKQNAQGTGLGLYISKSIVELHGGTIHAESAGKGMGSTFVFTLKESQNQNTPQAQQPYVNTVPSEIVTHTAL